MSLNKDTKPNQTYLPINQIWIQVLLRSNLFLENNPTCPQLHMMNALIQKKNYRSQKTSLTPNIGTYPRQWATMVESTCTWIITLETLENIKTASSIAAKSHSPTRECQLKI